MPCLISSVRCFCSPLKPRATNVAPAARAREMGLTGASMLPKSMPFGNIEAPVNPISLALAAGATFVARGFSGEQKHLTELIKQGIEHPGFSFLDVFSPCVTYNHDNTYQWFRPRVKKLEDDSAHDPTNWWTAMEKSLLWGDEIPIGKFFERTDVPTLHGAEPILDDGPLIQRGLHVATDA